MKPATTSAAIVRTLGSPTQIEFGQVPLPPLGDHEVRVRFLASEVNHVDLLVRSGKYPTSTPFPFIIGRDLVGDVVEVGPAVQHFSPGDLVWSNSCGYDGRQGSFASLVTVASERLHPLPSGIAPERAAAVPLPINALYTGDISVRGFVISNASVAALRQAATVVNTFLQRDVLRGKIGAEYPLAQAQAAHERLEEGRVEGRIVITP